MKDVYEIWDSMDLSLEHSRILAHSLANINPEHRPAPSIEANWIRDSTSLRVETMWIIHQSLVSRLAQADTNKRVDDELLALCEQSSLRMLVHIRELNAVTVSLSFISSGTPSHTLLIEYLRFPIVFRWPCIRAFPRLFVVASIASRSKLTSVTDLRHMISVPVSNVWSSSTKVEEMNWCIFSILSDASRI